MDSYFLVFVVYTEHVQVNSIGDQGDTCIKNKKKQKKKEKNVAEFKLNVTILCTVCSMRFMLYFQYSGISQV